MTFLRNNNVNRKSYIFDKHIKKKEVSNMANIPDIKVKVVYDSMDELITVPDVAKKMGTSQGFIHKLIQLKMLPAIYFGRYPRVRKFTLNAFLERFEGKHIIELVKAAERNTDNESKD